MFKSHVLYRILNNETSEIVCISQSFKLANIEHIYIFASNFTIDDIK